MSCISNGLQAVSFLFLTLVRGARGLPLFRFIRALAWLALAWRAGLRN